MIGKLALNAIDWLYNKTRIINPEKLYITLEKTYHSNYYNSIVKHIGAQDESRYYPNFIGTKIRYRKENGYMLVVLTFLKKQSI